MKNWVSEKVFSLSWQEQKDSGVTKSVKSGWDSRKKKIVTEFWEKKIYKSELAQELAQQIIFLQSFSNMLFGSSAATLVMNTLCICAVEPWPYSEDLLSDLMEL